MVATIAQQDVIHPQGNQVAAPQPLLKLEPYLDGPDLA
jgi:hypothetical protein